MDVLGVTPNEKRTQLHPPDYSLEKRCRHFPNLQRFKKQMRILIVHNEYKIRGGEDSVVENESSLLREFGNEVSVTRFSNDDVRSLADKVLTTLGVIYNKRSSQLIEHETERFRPDVIHVHNFYPRISPSVFFAARKFGIPIVQTVHNYRYICPGAFLLYKGKVCELCTTKTIAYPAVLRGCYRGSRLETALLTAMQTIHNLIGTWRDKVDGYIFLTEFAKTKFLKSKLKVHSNRLFVKPNYTFDEGQQVERGSHFLYVGRLSEEKGIKTLLDAFVDSPFDLKIVGSGPLESIVTAATARNPNIEYLGERDRLATSREMERCAALIVPSIWLEMFGLVNIEAFSVGCPVIATKLGAMAELIEDGKNGLHFEPGDADDLRRKVSYFLSNEVDRAQMMQCARDTYELKYSSEINYEQLIAIYKTVIMQKQKILSRS